MLGPLTAAALAAVSLALPAAAAVPGQLQRILDDARDDPLYRYPTSLTRDIVPKPVHSHNDYWRDVPFYSALARGCVSVEADVWLYDNDLLLVGHDRSSLSENRTFDSLYVQPILSVLRAQNPRHRFVPPGDAPTRNGVYDASPGQTLYLFVDVKTDGAATWPAVVRALGPLREAGYLTTVRSGTTAVVAPGPVTVVGTGNTPRALVEGAPAPRDYFWDAPAADLTRDEFRDVGAGLSPIASAGFGDVFGAGEGSAARRSARRTRGASRSGTGTRPGGPSRRGTRSGARCGRPVWTCSMRMILMMLLGFGRSRGCGVGWRSRTPCDTLYHNMQIDNH
ncbi:hypothetical protein RB595_008962 [Gaeumannomyces hyphopodioides]